ncbi:cytochrome c [Paenibacillus sp. GSMTC-2017]|uniref:c-type cytochrome n=1 Tax=Paenibacillus sp. GSMTC-2017 TaxID=2794350 RepID=UPI0018D97750|nr:cytochrome c [Paenibacillus sp. GSMTC-2017]MBH5317835.1 cytochrome c [Paenibacillus sp. GSMTC-2017]
MKRIYGFGLALIILLVLSGCGQKVDYTVLEATITTPADEEAVALYKKQCISCHAVDLSGRVGPELLTAGVRLTDEELELVIREGGKGMPSYHKRLSDKEIDGLVQWLSKME